MSIKPKVGVIYECYKGFTDKYGDRVRKGQKFILKDEDNIYDDCYILDKASGRGVDICINKDKFTSHFIPSDETTTEPKLKVGDRVKIKKDSMWYGDGDNNPTNVVGVINNTNNDSHYDLKITVDWDNGTYNAYKEEDLELADNEGGSYIEEMFSSIFGEKVKLNVATPLPIVVNSEEQIKELANVSFLKDIVEEKFPHLFVKHKIGNKYKTKTDKEYMLVGYGGKLGFLNIKLGIIVTKMVDVSDYYNISNEELKQFNINIDELELIK